MPRVMPSFSLEVSEIEMLKQRSQKGKGK